MNKFIAGAACALLFPILAQAQATITHLRPVATDTSVQLEIGLTAPNRQSVRLHATIAACNGGAVVWEGELQAARLTPGDTLTVNTAIEGIKAQLWNPAEPVLYNLTVRAGESSATKRIGFRRFEMRDGRFYLNGKPIFLRGNAINPPGRGIPTALEESKAFARDYVRFLKGMNINLIRIRNNQDWLDVCDEEGMMVFGGRYGRPHGGTEAAPPKDFAASVAHYKQVELGPLAWHPSVVIFVLSNEQAYAGAAGAAWDGFLQKAYDELRQWDHTRPYIGNAGYGLGRTADIYDVHRYWGWYYNTFLTFLNLRDMQAWQNEGRQQAITFTECVGNYTGIDGRYNLCSRTKQPYSQLCWTGHTPDEEQGAAALRYQAFVLKNTTEMFRRMRSQNPRLAGVMPFTIMFHNWDGIRTFAEMRPKPAAYQYGVSYQPVLLSWEMWASNVYAGKSFSGFAHIVNDDDRMQDLQGARVEWALEDINRIAVTSGRVDLPVVPYYGTYRFPLTVEIPANAPGGSYRLRGTIMRGESVVGENTAELFVAGREWKSAQKTGRKVALYDTKGVTAAAFDRLGIAYDRVKAIAPLSGETTLVIGELTWDKTLDGMQEQLKAFVARGGRIVCLRQDGKTFPTGWIPASVRMLHDSNNPMGYLEAEFMYMDGMNVNMERPSHAIFKGIERDHLRLWTDYTGFDESKPGFPAIYPVTQGFDLAGSDFSRVAVFANYSRGLAATALCEILAGKGSVILSGFDLSARAGIDPVADRLLVNLMEHACGAGQGDPYTLVTAPITWGDFASENGIVSLGNNSMILNTVPVVPVDQREQMPTTVDRMGYWYAGEHAGGWNTRPGVQYMPHGRRPFAPFTYSRGGNVIAQGDDRQAGGEFFAEVPAGRSRMVTTVENPSKESIELQIAVNGRGSRHTIAAGSVTELVTALEGQTRLHVAFTGDRRAVLLQTDFQ